MSDTRQCVYCKSPESLVGAGYNTKSQHVWVCKVCRHSQVEGESPSVRIQDIMRWERRSEADKLRIVHEYIEGYSIAVLRKKYGVTRSVLLRWMKALDLMHLWKRPGKRAPIKADDPKIIIRLLSMYESGIPICKICAKLGIGVTTFYKILHKNLGDLEAAIATRQREVRQP